MSQLFTPRAAREIALSLHSTLADAARLYRALERRAPPPGSAERPVDRAYFVGVSRLVAALERVRTSGAEVGDLRRGRLRFPARRAGRDVVLWWELSEPQAVWHGAARAEDDGGWEERG